MIAHELGSCGDIFYLAQREQNIFDTRASRYFIGAPSTMNENAYGKLSNENNG